MERIRVDPAALDSVEPSKEHDPDWIPKACEQIRWKRFAILNLPECHASLHERLLEAPTYPEAIRAQEEMSQELPQDFQDLCKAWNQTCERLCSRVADELLMRTRRSRQDSLKTKEAVSDGMLRISFNSTAGPHVDNSYVTMTSTGTVKGALHFSVLDSTAKLPTEWELKGQRFAPCEVFLGDDGSSRRDFVIFAGSQISDLSQAEYKPLLHVVEYPWKHSDQRINVIYFLRGFAVGDVASNSSRLEIHAFNRTVISDPSFIQRPLPPHQLPVSGGTIDASEDSEVSNGFAGPDWSDNLLPVF